MVDPRLVEAILIIKRRECLPESISEIAGAMGLSASRLSHIFTREIGTTPRRYIKSVRLGRAKKLLETSNLSCKRVAQEVGAGDLSHFARDYKKVYGLRPNQYRAWYKANHG